MKFINKAGFLIFLLVLTLGCLFTSCDTNKPPEPENTSSAEVTTDPGGQPQPVETKLIADKGTVLYTIVYPEDAASDVKDSVTYLYNAIKKRSNEGATQTITADVDSYQAAACEILIGDTGYPESQEVMNAIGYGDWTVRFRGNKLVVTGYSRDAIRAAVTELIQAVKNGATEDGTIAVAADLTLSGTTDAMINQLPHYESTSLPKTADEGQNTSLAVISGTNSAEFDAYLSRLEGQGYQAYTGNRIGENRFATYRNDSYVIHAGFYAYESAARVTIEKKTSLVPLESENQWTPDESVVTSLAQIGLGTEANAQAYNGMAYCYQLADGSFIVIDGGFYTDADRLYDYMKAKAPNGKVVIAAWFISHNDGDHTQCFASFSSKYRNDAIVEMVVKNFPNSYTYMESGSNENLAAQTGAANLPGCRVIKAHTGQKFYIRNAVVEILFTLDSYLPEPLTIFNNSSLVFTVDVEGERALFTGDASDAVAGILLSMYGDGLKSDILQLPHHGLRNGHGLKMPNTVKLMQAIRPEIVLWPSTDAHYLNVEGAVESQQVATFSWNLEAMKSAREVYIAGGDVITVLELPYRQFSAYRYAADGTRQPVAKDTPSSTDSLTYAESGKDADIPHVKWGD